MYGDKEPSDKKDSSKDKQDEKPKDDDNEVRPSFVEPSDRTWGTSRDPEIRGD